jgi:hypothetical protein
MEVDLNILKVKYLSNCLLNHTQISNLRFNYQILFRKTFKLRRPPMEDDFKIFKVKYLRNHFFDQIQVLNLDDQTTFLNPLLEQNLKY